LTNSLQVNCQITVISVNDKKVYKSKYGGYQNPPFKFPVVSEVNSLGDSKRNNRKQIMANLNNSALTLSVIFNKGEVKESKNRPDVMSALIHNGVVTCAYDSQKFFINFRMYSDKQGELPLFVRGGTKLKPVDQQISSKGFMDAFYGGNYIDTKFYVNISEDIWDAISDSSCKAIKLSFQTNAITERKDEEYQGNNTSCYQIDGVEIETLESYFGIGRKVDNDHVVNCVEQLVEVAVNKKSNVVTATELKEKGEKLGKNAKKRLVNEVRTAITNAAELGLLEEFNKDTLSGELDEVKEKLKTYKVRLAQLTAASKGVAESTPSNADNIEEAKSLSSEETASFLLDLIS
jgi:hypothetical protein